MRGPTAGWADAVGSLNPSKAELWEAVAAYSKFVELEPSNNGGWYNRGLAYQTLASGRRRSTITPEPSSCFRITITPCSGGRSPCRDAAVARAIAD